MKRSILVVLMMVACGGAQVRTEAAVEREVTGSCGSYDRQCDECLETLREQAKRSGIPMVDRWSCPACNQWDALCKGSTNKALKAWTGPIPEAQTKSEEEPETETTKEPEAETKEPETEPEGEES